MTDSTILAFRNATQEDDAVLRELVADPFTPTGDVVELLRARLATRAAARRRRRSRLRLPRLRPAH